MQVNSKRRRYVALAVALVASSIVVVASSGAAPAAKVDDPAAAAVTPTGAIPDKVLDRYLHTRPALGDVTTIDVSGEPDSRKLLATTLQGVVNRTEARIYLLGVRQLDQDQHWLDDYTARGLINVTATDSLDQALATFKGEVAGYVVGSYDEPWTINTATTVAGATGGVVITPDQIPAMQALGLTQIADHRGLWPDAPTAYEAIADQYAATMPMQTVGIEQPTANAPRDFFVQQGIMAIFTRPSDPNFDRIYELLKRFPADHPIYGYVSDTGDEELTALVALAQMGHYLVPTDSTDNLSFHIAVGATAARATIHQDTSEVAPCTSDTVNIAVSISDGDNMVVPENYFTSTDNWNSPRRGEIKVGWGIGPPAAVLMPSIWDTYASQATDNDEIIGMMGLGYALPSFMPDQVPYLTDSAALNKALGVQVHWSLDAPLSTPNATGWLKVDAAYADYPGLAGYLMNYEDFGGPPSFNTPDGHPVLAAKRDNYEVTPAGLADLIRDQMAKAPADRRLVTFLPATNWTSSYNALADALGPLTAEGVRFLTPRQALECLPKVEEPTEPTTEPPTTLPPTTGGPTTSSPSTTDLPSTTVPVTDALPTNATAPTYDGTGTYNPGTYDPGTGATYDPSTIATPVDAVPSYTG